MFVGKRTLERSFHCSPPVLYGVWSMDTHSNDLRMLFAVSTRPVLVLWYLPVCLLDVVIVHVLGGVLLGHHVAQQRWRDELRLFNRGLHANSASSTKTALGVHVGGRHGGKGYRCASRDCQQKSGDTGRELHGA